MNIIEIKTQEDFDKLPSTFSEFTEIRITGKYIAVNRVVGSSTVTAYGSSTVTAYDSSTVTAYGSSTVTAYGSSTVRAYGSSTVRAYGSSTVTAYGSSTVRAYGSSTVTAYGSSTVTAYDSSTVRAYDSSTVRAYDSSTVTAYDSSTVTAYDSSTVTAYDSSCIHNHSLSAILELFGFSVAILLCKAKKITRRNKTVTVVTPKKKTGVNLWLEDHGIAANTKYVTLYKRVSKDFKTQENTANETLWTLGATLIHPAWDPKKEECGGGKYHACPEPFFCDQYRDKADDKYIAIEVAKADLYAWPNGSHPHKIAFRKGTVLYEVKK